MSSSEALVRTLVKLESPTVSISRRVRLLVWFCRFCFISQSYAFPPSSPTGFQHLKTNVGSFLTFSLVFVEGARG